MQISGGKLRLVAARKLLLVSMWSTSDFFTATSSELKLNQETLPLTEAN